LSLTQSKDAPTELFVIIAVPQDEYEATQTRLLSSLKSSYSELNYISVLDHDKILQHAIKLPLPLSPLPAQEHDYNLRPRSTRKASDPDMSDASPSKRRKTTKGKAMKKQPSPRKSLLAYLTPRSY